MRLSLRLLALLLGASLIGSATATAAALSPKKQVAQMQKEWLGELRAAAKSGDRAARFPSPSRVVLIHRLQRGANRYHFQIVRVQVLRVLQSAPSIVIRSDNKRPIARATPAIIKLVDPTRLTASDPSGYAYEGYFFTAQDTHSQPYLATFNHARCCPPGGGEWAASKSLYPFPHW